MKEIFRTKLERPQIRVKECVILLFPVIFLENMEKYLSVRRVKIPLLQVKGGAHLITFEQDFALIPEDRWANPQIYSHIGVQYVYADQQCYLYGQRPHSCSCQIKGELKNRSISDLP